MINVFTHLDNILVLLNLDFFYYNLKMIFLTLYSINFPVVNFIIFYNLYILISLIILILFFFKKKSINLLRTLLFTISIAYFFLFIYWYHLSNLFIYYFFYYKLNWFGYILNIEYNIGIDNLSLIFLLLTTLLIPFCLLISWYNIYYSTKYFFLLFLILEFLLINIFSAVDILFFYFSFEALLIPMYLLIGYWGARQKKIHAGYLFFLFTFFGSLLMLISLLFCQSILGSTNLLFLTNVILSVYREMFIWILFFIGFSIKIPMMPVHLWLPEAHVESPTSGSVLLAGILLKLGTYGILKFLIYLFPFSSIFFSPIIYLVSFLGIIYGCLTTLRQIDIRKSLLIRQ